MPKYFISYTPCYLVLYLLRIASLIRLDNPLEAVRGIYSYLLTPIMWFCPFQYVYRSWLVPLLVLDCGKTYIWKIYVSYNFFGNLSLRYLLATYLFVTTCLDSLP